MKSFALLFLASLGFAGQGIVLRPGQWVYNNSIPALAGGTAYRVEESLQSLPSNCTTTAHVLYFNGGAVACSGSNLIFYLPTYTNSLFIALGALTNGFVTFRYQHLPGGVHDTLQAWDINGNIVFNETLTCTGRVTNSNGVQAGDGNAGGFAINYVRMYSSTVPLTAMPPTTSDTATNLVFQWKFDGNLNDSGSGGYTGVLNTGSAAYTATLGQTLVAPIVLNTNISPTWPAAIPGFQVSWRAGYPGGLSCASSYSQADVSAAVSCFWQVLLQPGQAAPFWSSQTSQTPTLTGLVFGDYAIQLTATDLAGNTGTTVTHIGAVATDANGVVVNANPAADAILGPMIAFGQNPWQLGDYWHLAGSVQRLSQYEAEGLSPTYPYAPWETPAAGTVNYAWTGVGMAPVYMAGVTGTTLSAACSSTATSCTVASTASLQLGTLPARVYISTNQNSGAYEEIRVCSVVGTTLTFCYDGRGYSDSSNPVRLAATSWSSGAVVGNMPLIGTGTAFTTTLCQAGAPGPMGSIAYNTGTVALTAGSTAVVLSGGAWLPALQYGSYYLRVSATHSSAPYVFIAPVSSVTDGTHLVLSRPFPSDSDTVSGLSYSIVNSNILAVMTYTVSQGQNPAVSFTKDWYQTFGCESDTLAYLFPAYDPGSFASTPVTANQTYTYMPNGGNWYNHTSTGGLDYYSEDLANLAGWLRSGLKQFHDSSMMIGDIWIRNPEVSNGGGGPLLTYGGPVVGGIANAVLSDTGHGTQWSDVRSFALRAITGFPYVASPSHDCNADDSRENGYQGAFLAMAAEFDPDTTSSYAPGGISWRQYWQNTLVQYEANEAGCANQFGNTDNSWRFTGGAPNISASNTVNLTSGSTAGTGTGLASNWCAGIANVSGVTVTHGSGVVTGTGFPTTGWDRVAITGPGLVGRDGNSVTTLWVYATPQSSTQFTIGGSGFSDVWPGTTNSSATVMFENANALYAPDAVVTFTASEADPMAQYQWSCVYNSSSSITLSSPWTGPTGTTYANIYNVTGFNILPYMLGIRQYAWLQAQQASATTQPSLSAQFGTLRNLAAVYERSVYDPAAGANYYAIQPACDPITLASMGNQVCYSGNPPTGTNAAYGYAAQRVNTIENSMSLTDYYLQQGASAPAIAWGDLMYGNCMGVPLYTQPGYHVAPDGWDCTSQGNLSANYQYGIGAGKWYGFFFGVGASWRWPAQRLGGVQAARPRAVFVGFDLGFVASATSVEIVVTAPSGAEATYACSSSPCEVKVDDRQGSHLYRMSYLSQTGAILAQSETRLLD